MQMICPDCKSFIILDALIATVERLTAERDKAVWAAKYGWHIYPCPAMLVDNEKGPCTCGYDDASAALNPHSKDGSYAHLSGQDFE